MAAVLAYLNEEESASITQLFTELLDTRMEMIGRAADFINNLDGKQKEVIDFVALESRRMSDRVREIITLNEGIEKTYADLQLLNAGTTTFAETTKAELAAGAVANEEAHQKDHVHGQVNELFAKTSVPFAENEKKLSEISTDFSAEVKSLRDGVQTWSQNFATEIQQMCQTGNFKFDVKPAVVMPKHDKKEVSVWKLPDGISKPDFRHWIDSIDIQLEAIYGFVFPDLVFEKIKRLPTEVTAASLLQVISEINVDHKKKLLAAWIVAGEAGPPGMGGADPWHQANQLMGPDLIDPSAWKFTEKS